MKKWLLLALAAGLAWFIYEWGETLLLAWIVKHYGIL